MESRDYRVSQGGLFHSHKVQYSKETQNLLNRLIEESKLSIIQRQALRETVKRGEALPDLSTRHRSAESPKSKEVLVPPVLPRRRSYQAIIKSGAYQRDEFHPPYNSNMKDREAEKQKLQSLMTYGKNVSSSSETQELKPNHRQKQKDQEHCMESEELFDHLVQEIKERLEFLQEMEELGEAKPHRLVIEQEIATRMTQMAKIDQQKFLNLGTTLEEIVKRLQALKVDQESKHHICVQILFSKLYQNSNNIQVLN